MSTATRPAQERGRDNFPIRIRHGVSVVVFMILLNQDFAKSCRQILEDEGIGLLSTKSYSRRNKEVITASGKPCLTCS